MKNSYFSKFIFAFTLLLVTSFGSLFAQKFTVSGVVTDATAGDNLIGANVYIPDLAIGAATDVNGEYSITVDKGTYNITCSYIGYERVDMEVVVDSDVTLNFSLTDYQFTLSVTVIADRVKERETPVAYSTIDKKDMEFELGSRDIPIILNTTPSVFATNQGGGYGDARFNVRGFNQRNVAVLINGIPQNDMENGWVYWSNWDGVGDVTSSIELQRGLGATSLATPSIGGTMNIITDPSQHKAGAFFKNEFGTGNFTKQSLFAHTGIVGGKFALSLGGVRKVGDGTADRTWTDSWAYYLGASYEINPKNRLEFYALGAPQQHGQRRWKLNTATFSHELARELGFPEAALNDPKLREQGPLYNSNWSPISSSYLGLQWERSYWNSNVNVRHDPGYLNESANYFHKPLVNLNWFSQLAETFSLYSTVYWSGGQGGGTGTFGSMNYNTSLLQRVVDWDSTIEENMGNLVFDDPFGSGDSSFYAISTDRRNDPTYNRSGILRNSVNSQWTVGAISKAYVKLSKSFTASFGIDLRKAEIDHYREVRDLLGNDFYHFNGNEFESGTDFFKLLGDHIDYDNTNTVNWLGGFVQGEYNKGKYTFYGNVGYSTIKYDFVDHFKMNASGNELTIETDWINGYQFKGGASFRVSNVVQLFVNGGYVSKVPIFDQVISDVDRTLVKNPKNEKFLSFEAGTNTNLLKNKLILSANVYYTTWTDRANNVVVMNTDGSEGLIKLDGISSRHMGVELEATIRPVRFISFSVAGSVGNWEYTEDVSGDYVINLGTGEKETFDFFIKGLKVGDAPQTQLITSVSIFPVPGMRAQILWSHYGNYYSEFDPFDRTNKDDLVGGKAQQVWQIPTYNLFDFNFAYDLPQDILGLDVVVFAHVYNIGNNLYVQDAVDNSAFNAWTGDGKNHKADDAEIYPGLPTTFNVGFSAAL